MTKKGCKNGVLDVSNTCIMIPRIVKICLTIMR